MDYTEVIINTRHENIDPDILVLESLGAEGFVIEDESDFKEFLEARLGAGGTLAAEELHGGKHVIQVLKIQHQFV